jgi:hypothetical protein
MPNNDERIAQLEAELAKLKSAMTPTPIDEAAIRAHRDQMHQLAEHRMSNAYAPSRAELDAYRAAAPDNVCRALARDGRAPIGPKSILPLARMFTLAVVLLGVEQDGCARCQSQILLASDTSINNSTIRTKWIWQSACNAKRRSDVRGLAERGERCLTKLDTRSRSECAVAKARSV